MFRIIVLLFTVFVITPAYADDAPRKIDFAKVLTGPDGPFRDCKKSDDAGKCVELVDLTLGRMCISAAAMPDKSMSPGDQAEHGHLAMRIVEVMSYTGTKEMALSSENITFLKIAITKLGYNTMAVYQATKMLDPTVDK